MLPKKLGILSLACMVRFWDDLAYAHSKPVALQPLCNPRAVRRCVECVDAMLAYSAADPALFRQANYHPGLVATTVFCILTYQSTQH